MSSRKIGAAISHSIGQKPVGFCEPSNRKLHSISEAWSKGQMQKTNCRRPNAKKQHCEVDSPAQGTISEVARESPWSHSGREPTVVY